MSGIGVDGLDVAVCVVNHVNVMVFVERDFAEDGAVIFDDHAVFVDGRKREGSSIFGACGDGAVIIRLEFEVASDGVGPHEEFDDVNDEPVGEDEEFVGRHDGKNPHEQGLDEDVAVNVFIEIIKEPGCAEATEATVENAAKCQGADGDFEPMFHKTSKDKSGMGAATKGELKSYM